MRRYLGVILLQMTTHHVEQLKQPLVSDECGSCVRSCCAVRTPWLVLCSFRRRSSSSGFHPTHLTTLKDAAALCEMIAFTHWFHLRAARSFTDWSRRCQTTSCACQYAAYCYFHADCTSGLCNWYSDVVLEAGASPRCRKFRYLGLMPAVLVSHWLASTFKNCLCLDIDLTISVSPWCASALARPDSGSPSSRIDTNSILVTYFHVHSSRSIVAFYQQSWAFAVLPGLTQ